MPDKPPPTVPSSTPRFMGQKSQKSDMHYEPGADQSVTSGAVIKPAAGTPSAQSTAQQCTGYDGKIHDCATVAVEAAVQQTRDVHLQAEIALWGLFFALATLVAAILAARWAKRSAKAAEDTLLHERNVSRLETRPWLTIDVEAKAATIEHDSITLIYDIAYKNIGQTPLRLTDFARRARPGSPIEPGPRTTMPFPDDPSFFAPRTSNEGSMLLPGDRVVSSIQDRTEWEEVQIAKIGVHDATIIHVDVNISYRWIEGQGCTGGTWLTFPIDAQQRVVGRPEAGVKGTANLVMREYWKTAI